ncbi:CHAT domain-containing protein [Sedimentitalea sp. XS_ASV28]|uniref:CHAT domain-containing protein n=1 Tax=Sedimentitalea sp. XS_ASV28 TaxID=3241296 RepID=UPI003514999F
MSRIFLPGQRVTLPQEEVVWPEHLSGVMTGRIIAAGHVSVGRGAGDGTDTFAVPDTEPTDILEIEFGDGLKLWQSVEMAASDFQSPANRSGDDAALAIPRELVFTDAAGQSRGVGKYLVRAVRLLRGDPVGQAGKLSAQALARKIEDSITPGFYRCDRKVVNGLGTIDLKTVKAEDIPTDQKILILVHGTFSSTQGSFGELAIAPAEEVWQPLQSAYPGGIYALEHASVTESPVKNAIDLVDALPRGAKISLMSHSRGGMVCELISRAAREDIDKTGAIDGTDMAIFKLFPDRTGQMKELEALNKALADKAPEVNRVIRVAGPMAGTTLASQRLDRYLSVALNVFELIPVLRRTGAADLLKSFLLAFIRTKADPATLPGLEAMMPTSPLTRMLNRPDVIYANGLRVIAGDTEGAGVLRRLGVFAADLFFRADHDFVVDTESMTRGGARGALIKPYLVKGPDVSHFSYFYNPDSRREIVGAAIEDDGGFLVLPGSRGVVSGEIPPEERFPELETRGSANDPVCFVLPGILGSHLSQDKDWIWTNPLQIAFGGLARIRIDRDKVRSTNPIKTYYWDLCRYLSRSHKVVPFDYDWRLSILEQGHADAARKLALLVEAELNRTSRPIRFLAHSMGGLVVRAMFQARPDLWTRIKERRESRFVMLGTPNGGAFSMMYTLLGRASSIRKLEVADFKHDMRELLSIVAGMPGALQLLPSDDNGRYLSDEFWDQMHTLYGADWVKPTSDALKIARTGRKVLDAHQLDPELTCYVAGLGKENTISSVRLDPSAKGKDRIKFFATPEGDGTVTWATGIPDGIPKWYVDAIHGDLPRTREAFPAYLDLLQTGTTARLSQHKPRTSRTADTTPTPVVDKPIELFPDHQDIIDDFLGGSGAAPTTVARQVSTTKVSVRHGNLRFASYPVAVGHHIDDPMMGAEKALDECLDYTLTNVRNLGLYPGELETCEVILREDRAPQGAVVVGLGTYGSLTPGKLKDTFRQAVLRYGLVTRERRKESSPAGNAALAPLGLSTLLIGHMGANITIQQSVEAILQAVAEANEALGETPIEHLEFVELFDDTAFQAASALDYVQSMGRMGDVFAFDGEIRTVRDARVRTHYGMQRDWWKRITVTAQNDAGDARGSANLDLSFTAISDNSRADFLTSAYQPHVLQQLLTQRTDGTTSNRDVGRLLFELLVPGDMKSFARNNENIMLILDKQTAAYPWELMEDDFKRYEFTGVRPAEDTVQNRETGPLVVRAPVIRRLITSGPKVPRPGESSALVVGDPKSDLPALVGAQEEARIVKELLEKADWKTTYLDQPQKGVEVIKEMILRPAKLIHLAGHGVYQSDRFARTGMVLGKDLFLTVSEINQMRYVPEFVFMNCCHLGHVGTEVNEIAASLSVAFVERGVRAVIAAGWEVDDDAAKQFARSFYTAMLAGHTFGKSVHLAREQVFQAYPETNTWGAYQCYGDPDYRFRDIAAETGEAPQTRYYSADQATKAARNIAEKAGSTRQGRAALMAQLVDIELSAKPDWETDGAWRAEMGKAYSRLNAFDTAISYLDKAMRATGRPGSLDAKHRLVDLGVRQASRAWRACETRKDRTAAARRVRAAVKEALASYDQLDALSGGEPSAYRLCLRGAALKCQALSDTGATRVKTLKRMTENYHAALLKSLADDSERINLYAGINWLTGVVILSALDETYTDQTVRSAAVWLDRLAAESGVQERLEPSFWNGIVRPQTDVLRGLLDPERADTKAETEIRFWLDRAWRRGGSFRQTASIRDQIAFIKAMMAHVDAQKGEWLTRIERIVTDLTADVQD